MSRLYPNAITLPDDMPLVQAAMLQATIDDAWKDYEGDPNNPEAFWDFLTLKDEGAAS